MTDDEVVLQIANILWSFEYVTSTKLEDEIQYEKDQGYYPSYRIKNLFLKAEHILQNLKQS